MKKTVKQKSVRKKKKKWPKILIVSLIGIVVLLNAANSIIKWRKNPVEPKVYTLTEETSSDKIYKEDKKTEEERLAASFHIEQGDTDDTVGQFFPKIKELLQKKDTAALIQRLDSSYMDRYHYYVNASQFAEKMEPFFYKMANGYELQLTKITKIGTHFLCDVSFYPIIVADTGEIQYDVENAYKDTFTIVDRKKGFTWLPFNEKIPGEGIVFFPQSSTITKEDGTTEKKNTHHFTTIKEDKKDKDKKEKKKEGQELEKQTEEEPADREP